jgi:hypothetical protein
MQAVPHRRLFQQRTRHEAGPAGLAVKFVARHQRRPGKGIRQCGKAGIEAKGPAKTSFALRALWRGVLSRHSRRQFKRASEASLMLLTEARHAGLTDRCTGPTAANRALARNAVHDQSGKGAEVHHVNILVSAFLLFFSSPSFASPL